MIPEEEKKALPDFYKSILEESEKELAIKHSAGSAETPNTQQQVPE